ncbi:MAG: PorT family protein [Saprospiraceae bacterium]|nr:PorT family protein [Saprospiraceae bacterium]MDW8484360.1 outer membrane beta-barrel protein [Saprospiraceae bacterium]
MRTTHSRHLLYLHGRKRLITIVWLAFFALSATFAWAQRAKGYNFNYKDFQAKPYYFGISLGMNFSDFKIYHSRQFIRNDSFARAEAVRGPGFNLGIVSNLKIGEYFDVRVLPTLSFVERNLRYTRPGDGVQAINRRIESVLVEMPFQVRYKSAAYHDFRIFLVAGAKYIFDVASDSRTRQAADLVKISPTDFQFEYGAGVQFFFPYFIFSPEFKVSHGLNNILLYNERLQQSTVLEKILSRTFTITFYFEG